MTPGNEMTGTSGRALLSLAIRPKTEVDRGRLARGVATLLADDPTLSATTHSTTGEFVIAGIGELQLEVTIDRLKREFNVEAAVGRLEVAYKERLTREADGEGRLARQSEGRGQYAHAKVHVYRRVRSRSSRVAPPTPRPTGCDRSM